jgi:tetratricopeptide (TPR) repeat protein
MMTYLAVVLLGFVAVLLFRARGMFGAIFSDARMRAGDYDGALRRVRWLSLGIPNVTALHKEALILSVAGRPAEAERRYRKALGMVPSDSRYPRQRLQAGLGHTLVDLGRYEDAEPCFQQAIEAGDVTGSSEDGLARSRLARAVEAEQALAYAGEAIERATRRGDRRADGAYSARQAWALALLGRSEEARASLAEALRVPEPSAPGRASQHWHAGMVLLGMGQTAEAREHFRIARDADPNGKFGRRSAEQLGGAP